MMLNRIRIPRSVKPLTKWLTKNNINLRIDVDSYGKTYFTYETNNYRCVLAEVSIHKPEDKFGFNKRLTHFNNPYKLYTPFMENIIDPDNFYNQQQLFYNPTLNSKEDLNVFKQIVSEALKVLKNSNLPETLLPQFLALSASRIYTVNKISQSNLYTYTKPLETYYYKHLDIEEQMRLTVEQVAEYLYKTTNVDIIIQMWELGLMPDQYETYITEYVDAPKEWLKLLYSDNIKDHTNIKETV